jgi:hypothetical protein
MAEGINSSESIPGLLKSLKIRAQVLFSYGCSDENRYEKDNNHLEEVNNFSFDIIMLFNNNKFNEVGIYFSQC